MITKTKDESVVLLNYAQKEYDLGNFRASVADVIKNAKNNEAIEAKGEDYTPSKDLFSNLLKLAAGLRARGFDEEASSLEGKIGLFKMAKQEKDDAIKKMIDDKLIDFAHKEGDVEVAPSEYNYGQVEKINTKQKRILDSVNRKPTGDNSPRKLAFTNLVVEAQEEDIAEQIRAKAANDRKKVDKMASELSTTVGTILAKPFVVFKFLDLYSKGGSFKKFADAVAGSSLSVDFNRIMLLKNNGINTNSLDRIESGLSDLVYSVDPEDSQNNVRNFYNKLEGGVPEGFYISGKEKYHIDHLYGYFKASFNKLLNAYKAISSVWQDIAKAIKTKVRSVQSKLRKKSTPVIGRDTESYFKVIKHFQNVQRGIKDIKNKISKNKVLINSIDSDLYKTMIANSNKAERQVDQDIAELYGMMPGGYGKKPDVSTLDTTISRLGKVLDFAYRYLKGAREERNKEAETAAINLIKRVENERGLLNTAKRRNRTFAFMNTNSSYKSAFGGNLNSNDDIANIAKNYADTYRLDLGE